jgi:hypothetical protein
MIGGMASTVTTMSVQLGECVALVPAIVRRRARRFLLLGKPRTPGGFRPTQGAGDIDLETLDCTVTHGVASLRQLAELEAELRRRNRNRQPAAVAR